MNLRRNAIRLIAIAAMGCGAGTASAQLPGLPQSGAGGSTAGSAAAAARAQAQVQQRVQAQVSQRAAAQIQAGVQTQTQTRLQADAARAANAAARAAGTARQAAAAGRQRAAAGPPVNVGLGLETAAEARVGNRSARANANARLGIYSGNLPAGLSEADVQVYDSVFGRFNPLRRGPGEDRSTDGAETPPTQEAPPQEPAPENGAPLASDRAQGEPRDQSTQDGQATQDDQEDPSEEAAAPRERKPLAALDGQVEFAARLQVAAQQRRAEIAQLRDHALATSNAQLMLQADRMERTLDRFLEARLRAAANGGAAAGNAPQSKAANIPALGVQGRARATGAGMIEAPYPRTATRSAADIQSESSTRLQP